MSENDQPFSKQYENYSLENLIGDTYYVDGCANWEDVFMKIKPSCPSCGKELTEKDFDTKS